MPARLALRLAGLAALLLTQGFALSHFLSYTLPEEFSGLVGIDPGALDRLVRQGVRCPAESRQHLRRPPRPVRRAGGTKPTKGRKGSVRCGWVLFGAGHPFAPCARSEDGPHAR